MSLATLTTTDRALDVISLRLVLPLRGAWWATIEVDAMPDEAPRDGSEARLSIAGVGSGGRSWLGYIARSRAWHGRTRLFFEAGKTGMRAPLLARSYSSALLRTIAEHAISEAGELLAAASLAVTDVLESYTRASAPAGVALTHAIKSRGIGWRFTDDGEVLLLRETWPDADTTDVLEVEPFDDAGSTTTEPLAPTLSPGSVWYGRRIERVVYTLTDEEPLAAELVFEPREGAGEEGDLRGLFGRAVRASVPELPYLARHPATVSSQDGAGRVDLLPDSTAIGGDGRGTGPIPIVYGLPGARATLPEGSRVGLTFDGGDRERGRAIGFEEGTAATLVELDAEAVKLGAAATRGAVRIGDRGVAGTIAAPAGTGTLVWTLQDGSVQTISFVSATPGSPVVITIAPGVAGFDVVTESTRGSSKVSIE